MKFYNTTSGKMVELTIIDSKSGNEWTQDLLGNNNALEYNDETENFEIDQDNFEWWSDIIEKLDAIDDRIAYLKENTSSDLHDEIDEEINCAGNSNDLESHVDQVNAKIDELIAYYEVREEE